MKLLNVFGIGEQELFSQGIKTEGIVTDVRTWRFLKVNTKPMRVTASDGAAFPHRILFRYEAEGGPYTGSRVLSPSTDCPAVGDRVTVYYDEEKPQRCAVKIVYG